VEQAEGVGLPHADLRWEREKNKELHDFVKIVGKHQTGVR
jgi:hypothetical protein